MAQVIENIQTETMPSNVMRSETKLVAADDALKAENVRRAAEIEIAYSEDGA